MLTLLARLFIKNRQNTGDPKVRRAYGSLCSAMGIGFNILLFIGKFIAGVLSASIAVTADAFNNLSDAGSSLITLIGFKLSGQKPDPEHPYGHGRLEYISGLIVSMLILLMGFTLFKSSGEKIFHPEKITFSYLSVGILAVSICVKLYMFFYNRHIGKKINSAAVLAASTDSLSDSVATSVVLISTVIFRFTDINIDGWCGVAVALFIIVAGINSARETIGPLLGQPPEPEFVKSIEDIVLSHKDIIGLHDLVVHNYGPGRVMISLHAEIPADGNLMQMHDTVDNIERDLKRELGCNAVIHMDPVVTDDALTSETRHRVEKAIKTVDERMTLHDFRMVVGPTHTNVIFDVTAPLDLKLTEAEIRGKVQTLTEVCGDNLYAVVTVDRSMT